MVRRPFSRLLAILLGLAVSRATFAANPQPLIVPDIVYGHKDGLALTMDQHRPNGEANGAAILYMVSGGWRSRWSPPEETRQGFRHYLTRGYTVFAVRHGSSPRYSIPEAVTDVRQAVRFVRSNALQLGIDPHRLGALGSSAGGHLAMMLATTGDDGFPDASDTLSRTSSRVAVAVAMVPPTDLRKMVWEASESLPSYRGIPALELSLALAERHSPVVHVTNDDAPALVLVGEADELVPPVHGDWISEAYQKADVELKLIVFPETGHNLATPRNRARLTDEVVGWFDRYLQPPSEN